MEEKKYLNFGRKLAYGSGDLASNFVYMFITSFVLIYLTDTVGLNSATIGMLMLISKVFDGITDIFFGTMIDRTRSKMGKARPWMFWSTFMLGIFLVLQFTVPNASQTLQYAYFFIIYTIINAIFYTANNIAYSTLTALITKNVGERVQLGVFRFIFALVAALVVSSITMNLVTSFGGGNKGWMMVAIIYAAIHVIVNTICVLCVKELPESELTDGKEVQKTKFVENFKYLVHNKFYLSILGIYLSQNIMAGISAGAGIYFMTYVLGNAALLGPFSMAGMLPMIIGLVFLPFFIKKWGMYKTTLVSMIAVCLLSIPYMIFGWQGAVTMMLVFMALRGIFMSPLTGSLMAFIAEASTFTFLRDGVRIDGTMYSCSSLGIKLGSGIGSAVCGWLLAAGGYDGTAEVQSADALNMISVMYVILPTVFYLLMTWFASRLKVEKANKELSEKITE